MKYVKRNINKFKSRLKHVVILNEDLEEVIRKYDSADAFFYIDPPYEKGMTKSWTYPPFDSNRLFAICDRIKGRFLLSYNDTAPVRSLFKKFNVVETSVPYSCTRKGSVHYTELLISNYVLK